LASKGVVPDFYDSPIFDFGYERATTTTIQGA
jgi:hypothetical protein